MSTICFDGVAKWYGAVIGIVDATIDLPSGVIGLLGPNGAGKSTLLKLLTGQIRPSQGTVRVLGTDPFRSPELYRRIGFCPEQDAFYENMRGRDFVRYLGSFHGLGGRALTDRVEEVLEQVDLNDEAHRRIRTYSKGMRQRIKLAQALVHDPEILVLDEPLTGMDPLGRRKTVALVKQLATEGRTVLVSSHVLHEVEAMTSQVVLMYQGRVRAHGELEEIRSYLDQYPHKILVRSSRARELAGHLLKLETVLSVRLDDDKIHLEARKPEELYAALPGLVVDSGFELDELQVEDASLEAIFKYMVRR